MGEVPGRSGASREVPGRKPDGSKPYTYNHRKMALTKNHNLLVGSAMPSLSAGQPVGATAQSKCNPITAYGYKNAAVSNN